MKTPYGFECRWFYGNYFRGRDLEECRLLTAPSDRSRWKSNLCRTCPVPSIENANACQNMHLHATVSSGILGFGKHMQISASCTLSQGVVREPQLGCGKCHDLKDLFHVH